MPAMPGEFSLTGKQGSIILEKCAEYPDMTYERFRACSACLSYLYQVSVDGEMVKKKNWPEVTRIYNDYTEEDFAPPTVTRKPEAAPTPAQLKRAFTTAGSRACGWTLAKWFSGLIAAWLWAVLGNRPQVDMTDIKNSEEHTLALDQGWGCTAMVKGRNKLCDRKKGTRPWNAYYLCLCPGGKHQPIPADYEWTFNRDGQPHADPTFCTSCPLNAVSFKIRRWGGALGNPRVLAKWIKSKVGFGSNWGEPVKLATEWLALVGVTPPPGLCFSTNGGRTCLGNWLTEVHAPFHEGHEIHGDLPEVWVTYQPTVPRTSFARRTQSKDPIIATAALRRFARYIGCGARAVAPEGLSLEARMMMAFMESQGQALLAQRVVHEQTQGVN